MSYRDLNDYCHSVINEDSGEAIAFFILEEDAEMFCKMKNKDTQDKIHYWVGAYIDSDIDISVQGS